MLCACLFYSWCVAWQSVSHMSCNLSDVNSVSIWSSTFNLKVVAVVLLIKNDVIHPKWCKRAAIMWHRIPNTAWVRADSTQKACNADLQRTFDSNVWYQALTCYTACTFNSMTQQLDFQIWIMQTVLTCLFEDVSLHLAIHLYMYTKVGEGAPQRWSSLLHLNAAKKVPKLISQAYKWLNHTKIHWANRKLDGHHSFTKSQRAWQIQSMWQNSGEHWSQRG